MKVKNSSPSSSHTSIITRVFPGSWFSRFKQKGNNPETHDSVSKKQRGKLDYPSSYSSLTPRWGEGKFHRVDDDAYWSLSFRKDRIQGSSSKGGNGHGINLLWYDSENASPVPWREMDVPRREARQSFNDTVSDIMRMKERRQYHYKGDVLPHNGALRRQTQNAEAEFSAAQRKKDGNGRCSRKQSRRLVKRREAELTREFDDGEDKSSKPEERDAFATEPQNTGMKEELLDSAVSDSRSWQNTSFSNSSPYTAEEGLAFADPNGDESNSTPERTSILDRKIFEDKKFKAARMKRKSANTRRQSRARKLKQNGEKTYSPQKEFRIRVLDDMKKARMKSKKERNLQVAHGRTVFDSFAVIKASTNPWHDFKDSMVEMITEKHIKQPEELEELLASYLTLNCDEHHDLIIKVFLDVCFELNKEGRGS